MVSGSGVCSFAEGGALYSVGPCKTQFVNGQPGAKACGGCGDCGADPCGVPGAIASAFTSGIGGNGLTSAVSALSRSGCAMPSAAANRVAECSSWRHERRDITAPRPNCGLRL